MLNLDEIVDGGLRLIPLPQAYLRIRDLVNDPRASTGSIAGVIATDPALTARLLRVANAPIFGCAGRVDTVTKAVHLLGATEIHNLALAVSTLGAAHRLGGDLVDAEAFWRYSVHTAVLARTLGRKLRSIQAEGLFVAGLLHAIGHLLLCHRLPEEMRAVLASSRAGSRPLHAVERERFGLDYAAVGAALLGRWQLPPALCDAIGGHTAPVQGERFSLDAAIVHIAAVLAAGAAWREGDPDTVPDIEPLAILVTDLDVDTVPALLAETEVQVAEALLALRPQRAAA
ncbi:MAG: HDOD domain-containing protein [Gammaproteobacteria bacterium]